MSGNDQWWDNYLAEQRENRKEVVRQQDEQRDAEQRENRRQQAMAGSVGDYRSGADMLKSLIGCVLLLPVLFVGIYLIGWAIATFVVK